MLSIGCSSFRFENGVRALTLALVTSMKLVMALRAMQDHPVFMELTSSNDEDLPLLKKMSPDFLVDPSHNSREFISMEIGHFSKVHSWNDLYSTSLKLILSFPKNSFSTFPHFRYGRG